MPGPILDNLRRMDRRAAFDRRGETANFAPIHRDEIIIHPSFQVGEHGMHVATRTVLLLRPGRIVTQTVANERHSVIEQPGSYYFPNLAGRARSTVIPHNLHNTS